MPEKFSGDVEHTDVPVKGEKGRHKWLGYLWDTANNSQEERKLLYKVDAAILSIFCLGYLCKSLDQSNVSNAFLSGMKEDLGLYGNELVHSQTIYNIGYILGQLPFTLLLTRLPAHYCIPAIEFGVGFATLGNYAINNTSSLFAVRFLAGFFEGGYFPGVMFILSSWYTPAELGKRSGLFYASGNLGSMFSGFFQAAAYKNLNGVGGIAGWRWLFIIDAIFTLGVAMLGIVFIPDIPALAKPNFLLTQADIDLANARLARIERAPPTRWTWAKAKRILLTWQVLLFPIMYALYNSGTPQQGMGFPLPYLAIAALTCILLTWISDGPLRGRRWPVVLVCAGGNFGVSLALYVMPLYTNISGRTVAYYFNYISTAAAMAIYSWAAECTSFDNELRAIVSAVSNMLAYIINTITPNFVWKTVDFPAAKHGYEFSIAFSVAQFVVVPLAMFLATRDAKIAAARRQDQERATSPGLSHDEKETDVDPNGVEPVLTLSRAIAAH